MIANVNAPLLSSRIDYCLAATEKGWQLTAWEPALVEGNRVKPYLWKFNSELGTLQEAHRTLQVILGQD
ncbi:MULTISPECIES: hypothetical protein [unclassified Coleofasciculus]|uniref:hypothetical protein n=1 Tax=unclassified Coleofasciculus TaxID=2692782 RepID=UPI0018821372|nr:MULTISPECIES: hypothetical protein [unclassified Coleofasciculus]MBE9125309.1 hypothetical protein [Coleofasciculus sp. LEGE 07081]MBE9147090.1 hypothetical protein [Coleofasciculus sp. LEGE 07092]